MTRPMRKTNSQADINEALRMQIGRMLLRFDQLDRRLALVVSDQDSMNARVAARLTALEAEVAADRS